MNRKVETVLSMIGVVSSVLLLFLGVVLDFLNENQIQMLGVTGDTTTLLTIASIIGIVLGTIAIMFLRENKMPKIAGGLLIVAAVLVFIISKMNGFLFPASFFLIAGIFALVKRPKKNVTFVS
ncbi:DUF4064 domain-containing protein [Oceanobacillus kimchii]|uniref:DUF4064 domain-containing protein n=1 Tax=Oceanobacillus kimchii TaxID=746691 RepID=UPI0009842BFC|nr:DUF4064 domain-containing protein [Oceanobacillus kimchii]